MPEIVEVESQARRRSFLERLQSAMKLDPTLYGEVEADPGALLPAGLVVALGGLGRGIGAFGEEGWIGFFASPILGLIGWLLAGAVIWLVGVAKFKYTSDYRELLRTVGFAAAPLIWLALCVLPIGILGTILWIAAHAWAALALVIAAREALDVSTKRALIVCTLALALVFVSILLIGLLFIDHRASI